MPGHIQQRCVCVLFSFGFMTQFGCCRCLQHIALWRVVVCVWFSNLCPLPLPSRGGMGYDISIFRIAGHCKHTKLVVYGADTNGNSGNRAWVDIMHVQFGGIVPCVVCVCVCASKITFEQHYSVHFVGSISNKLGKCLEEPTGVGCFTFPGIPPNAAAASPTPPQFIFFGRKTG